MKKLCILFCLALFLSGCVDHNSSLQTDISATTKGLSGSLTESDAQYDIIGKYVCVSDYCTKGIDPEYCPSINFYENGICKLFVNCLEGIANLDGVYCFDGNAVKVSVDLRDTVLEGTDQDGLPYMNDEYVFTIIDNDHLVIDRGFYVVKAGDPFEKISTEPDPST